MKISFTVAILNDREISYKNKKPSREAPQNNAIDGIHKLTFGARNDAKNTFIANATPK